MIRFTYAYEFSGALGFLYVRRHDCYGFTDFSMVVLDGLLHPVYMTQLARPTCFGHLFLAPILSPTLCFFLRSRAL